MPQNGWPDVGITRTTITMHIITFIIHTVSTSMFDELQIDLLKYTFYDQFVSF